VPVDLDPTAVMKREEEGHPPAALAMELAMLYVERRQLELSDAGRTLDTSDPALFDLGRVLAWTRENRDELRGMSGDLDATFRRNLARWRREYDADPQKIDSLANAPLRLDHRAAHVFWNLMRTMVRESKSHGFKRNDGLDLCHAVVAVAYSMVATLDGNWQRRARMIPSAERLARVYFGPELERLVTDLETLDPAAEPPSQSEKPSQAPRT